MASEMCARKSSYRRFEVETCGTGRAKERLEEPTSSAPRGSASPRYSSRDRGARNRLSHGVQDARSYRSGPLRDSESRSPQGRRDRHYRAGGRPRSLEWKSSPGNRAQRPRSDDASADGTSSPQKGSKAPNRRSPSGRRRPVYGGGTSSRQVSHSSSTGLESGARRDSKREASNPTTTNDARDDDPCHVRRSPHRGRFVRHASRDGSSQSMSLHSSYSSHSCHYGQTPSQSRKRPTAYHGRSSGTPSKKRISKEALPSSNSDEDTSGRFARQARRRRTGARPEEKGRDNIAQKERRTSSLQEGCFPASESAVRDHKASEIKTAPEEDVLARLTAPSLESFLECHIQQKIKQEVGKRVEAYLQSSKFQNEVENRIAAALQNLEQHVQERLEAETQRIVETFKRVETQKRLQNQRTEEILAENDRRIREEQRRLAQEKAERDEQRLKELERICEHKRMEKHKRMELAASTSAICEPQISAAALAQQRRLSATTGPRLIAFRVGSGRTAQNTTEPPEP